MIHAMACFATVGGAAGIVIIPQYVSRVFIFHITFVLWVPTFWFEQSTYKCLAYSNTYRNAVGKASFESDIDELKIGFSVLIKKSDCDGAILSSVAQRRSMRGAAMFGNLASDGFRRKEASFRSKSAA
jgi:hypothetical protein